MFAQDSFLGQLIRHPIEVMALAPSSIALCRMMAQQVAGSTGPIVELGAGTGKITSALLEAGISPHQLHLIELNDAFVPKLREQFPQVTVHHTGAQNVADLGLGTVDAVVSGLPLLGMSKELQGAIVRGVFNVLPAGAPFVQFTYGPKPPIRSALRQELNLTATRVGGVLANLPPASVYRFSQNSPN